MIKKENEGLRRSLDKRTRQLDRMQSEHRGCESDRKRLSEVEKKLERERMKAKMMARRIKDCVKTDLQTVIILKLGFMIVFMVQYQKSALLLFLTKFLQNTIDQYIYLNNKPDSPW